jgi:hypothetical protein
MGYPSCSCSCSRSDGACISVLLNTAEGNGKRRGLQRARFFDDARGSAVECATCLDVSVAKRITKSDRIRSGSLHARDFEHEHEHEDERERGIRFATVFSSPNSFDEAERFQSLHRTEIPADFYAIQAGEASTPR